MSIDDALIPERLEPGSAAWAHFYSEHAQRYEFASAHCRNRLVLDAGCGVGYGACILAEGGARFVLGIDISPDAISCARRRFSHPKVEFLQHDMQELQSLKKRFDVIVSFEAIEHLAHPSRFLEAACAVLRRQGLFICSTPNKAWHLRKAYAPNPHHRSEMTYAEFAALFSRHFTIEGKYHQSHTESFRRYQELLNEVARLERAVRFSKLLAFENWIRKRLGRATWELRPPAQELSSCIPGDFEIRPFETPNESHLTYILIGHRRNSPGVTRADFSEVAHRAPISRRPADDSEMDAQ
jgi:2-polyprenyl-3-methyl-5-hydroxy-6-metoxy-1,4-benzoquinol methylase